MKKNGLLFFIGLLIISCNQQFQKETGEKVATEISEDSLRDGVFIHISHGYNDPHRVLMALQMAYMMSNDKDVLIYLDIQAVHLVTKNSKNLSLGNFMPLQESLQNLLEMDVEIYVCPGCMKEAGIEESDLMSGIKMAQKDRFFDFTKGRILTLDY